MPGRGPAPVDLAARVPVWDALADLFLDTDLTFVLPGASGPARLEGVARALAASPYTVDELRAIELWEVAPGAMPHPLDVAPEWLSHASPAFFRACARRAWRRGWWLRLRVRLGFGRAVRRSTARYWAYLAPRIAELRG